VTWPFDVGERRLDGYEADRATKPPPSVMVTPSFEGRSRNGAQNGANFLSTA
jgi:hypothetical protein